MNELSICTLSIGSCEHHTLADKLQAAKQAGFKAVELYWPDYLAYEAQAIHEDYETGDVLSIKAANRLKKMCDALEIRLVALQ